MPTRARPRPLTTGLIAGLLATLAPGSLLAQVPAPAPAPARTDAAKAAITKVLDDQTLAWNRGDLDAFLEGYWRSPQVVFQSGGTRHDGFDAMRDRYRKRYQSDGKSMGQVAFSGVEIEPLSPDSAFVRGRFTLALPDGTHPTGLFTLIMRRFDDGWKIIHDHTSTAETPVPAANPLTPPAPAPPMPPPPTGAVIGRP